MLSFLWLLKIHTLNGMVVFSNRITMFIHSKHSAVSNNVTAIARTSQNTVSNVVCSYSIGARDRGSKRPLKVGKCAPRILYIVPAALKSELTISNNTWFKSSPRVLTNKKVPMIK